MKLSTFSLFSLNALAEQATNSAAIDAKIAELSPIGIAGEWQCEKVEKTEKRMLAKCVAVCPDFDGTFNYLPMFKRASAKIVARHGEAEIITEQIKGTLSCWDEVETFMTPAFMEENHQVRRGTWSCLAKENGSVFCRNKCNDSGEVRVTAKMDQRGMDFSKAKPYSKRACIDE